MYKKIYKSIGLMSGTSADGVDVSLIESDGEKTINILKEGFFPYSEDLKKKIKTSYIKRKNCWKISNDITNAHINAIHEVIDKDLISTVDIIGFHGQTIYHDPKNFCTIQIGNPFMLAKAIQKPVISNFREKDIMYGGQGAPLVPVYHYNLLKNFINKNTAIVNIGGIANITIMEKEESNIIAGDTGPGCLIIDHILNNFNKNFDALLNKKNKPNAMVLKKIFKDVFFRKPLPKSLTTQYFYKYLKLFDSLSLDEALATASECTAQSILLTKEKHNISQWIISGGGRKNNIIIDAMKNYSNKQNIIIIDDLGINGDFLEAQAFAYLAIRHLLNKPFTYPKTTGVIKPLSGGVFYQP